MIAIWAITVGILIMLMFPLGQSTSAISAYDSGHDHGCSDAHSGGHPYLDSPGKGPSFHTDIFMQGYNDGYSACSDGSSRGTSADTSGGGVRAERSSHENFASECNAIQGILVQRCTDLVNPDGTLTADGNKANTCIRNGIVLGLGGFFASGGDIGSLPLIIQGLKILSKQTGCDGVVNWDSLGLDQLSLLKRIFH